MIFPDCCPSCGQPVAAWEWLHCVVVDRAGTRAHLACLEAPTGPGREASCGYLLAPRLCNPGLLRPGAQFVALAGDSVVVEVPTPEMAAQERALGGADRPWFFTRDLALRVAAGMAPPMQPPDPAAIYAQGDSYQIGMTSTPASLPTNLPIPPAPPNNLRVVDNRGSPGSSWAAVTFAWDPSPDAAGGYELALDDASCMSTQYFTVAPGTTSYCGYVTRGAGFRLSLCALTVIGLQSLATTLQGVAVR